jgi:hypothetical protein
MKSTQTKTVISFILFVLIFGVTHFAVFPGSVEYFKQVTNDQPLLDLKPEFSTQGVYERLHNLGDDGRAAYLKLVPAIDLIFPLSAFIFFLMLCRLSAEKYPHAAYARFYWVVPLFYLLMDFMENAFVVLILVNYPNQLEPISSVVGFISVTKRVFMILSIAVPLIIILFAAIRNRNLSTTKGKYGSR